MCGNYPKGCTGYLTDRMARGHLHVHVSGALPSLYDDSSTDTTLNTLMNSFGGTEIGTHRAQCSARCSPIVTCNEFQELITSYVTCHK